MYGSLDMEESMPISLANAYVDLGCFCRNLNVHAGLFVLIFRNFILRSYVVLSEELVLYISMLNSF